MVPHDELGIRPTGFPQVGHLIFELYHTDHIKTEIKVISGVMYSDRAHGSVTSKTTNARRVMKNFLLGFILVATAVVSKKFQHVIAGLRGISRIFTMPRLSLA
jgi:hypothetical protein